MSMADRIKAKRIELGLTQEELAARLGLQKSAIAKYENGRVTNIKRTTIAKLAELFQCDPSWLMDLDDNSNMTNTLDADTYEKLRELAKDKIVIDMYLDLDTTRKTQASSYIRYLHNEWEAESSTENGTADVVPFRQDEPDYLLPNAAHENNPTPEQKKHADDIMFNDDEWK